MEQIYVEPEARFRLERLCDNKHPFEVGGYILGETVKEDVVIQDIFPVPNTSDTKRSSFKEHNWSKYWSQLYADTVNLKNLGRFHSHPNGTIPSEQDMKACTGLNLWVIHHARGEHTYRASREFRDREVLLLNEPHEIVKPHFVGDSFHLGTTSIDAQGRLCIDEVSRNLMALPNETRRILLLSWQYVNYGNVELDQVIQQSGRKKSTVRKHLNLCVKKGLLEMGYTRGKYRVAKEF